MEIELNEKTFQVLKKHGVSLAEHYVMGTVGYGIWLPADDLAEHTVKLVEGDSRGNFPPHEYLDAVNECIKKGWLKTYAPEMDSVEQQALSQSADSSEMEFNPGDVKFTKAGYLLHHQTILEIFGEGLGEKLDFASNGIAE